MTADTRPRAESDASYSGNDASCSIATHPATVIGADRVHYLDNLRALAMLLGVFLHAALAYAEPAQTIWLATDPRSSVGVDAVIWFIHLFRMGLFFLLSGYFAKLVISRKGLRSFTTNRLLRIALPFVIFYLPLLVGMTVVIVFALSYLQAPRGLMGYIAQVANQPDAGANRDSSGTMHLWFLYYLFFFSIIAVLLASCKRLLAVRRDANRQRGVDSLLYPQTARSRWSHAFTFERLRRRPWLCLLMPLALVPAVLTAGTPLPAPESFSPTWWPFIFYGGFYCAGWCLYGRETVLDMLNPYTWPLLFGCVVFYIPYYLCLPTIDLSLLTGPNSAAWLAGERSWQSFLAVLLNAYLAVALTIAALLIGKRCLSQHHCWLRFIADSSYWIYLVHLPIVVFLQTLLIPWDGYIGVKLTIVIVTTMAFSLATYVVFVRYTPLGWMLNGKKPFP